MSKLIYACLREGSPEAIDTLRRRITSGASRMEPAGANLRPTRLILQGRIIAAILNPSTTNAVAAGSVCIGHVSPTSRWAEVGTGKPEGTYAICRASSRKIEILSDAVGSRTLWYYFDDSIFVASTSQRWLAIILRSFEPNRRVLAWMLATGCLGPSDAWDARLQRLQADSLLEIDLGRWTKRLTCGKPEFGAAGISRATCKQALRDSLRNTFASLDFDYSKWVLPLSGGYDSRGILCLLRHGTNLRTITWGTESSIHDSGSDAAIALQLAKAAGVAHEYFKLDLSVGSLEDVIDRFVANGDGRTEYIAGYLDGFAMWQTLFDRGFEGVIRGDEGFGWVPVWSHREARKSVGLFFWSDFSNLPSLEELELTPQEMPEFLLNRAGESPSQWRDRLYHQYRIPTIMAAQTDLKAPFVEIANPLLSHSIISSARMLPDRMRTQKRLFRELVDEIGPAVGFAESLSIADPKDILRSAEAEEVFRNVLNSDRARTIFPKRFLELVLGRFRRQRADTSRKTLPYRMQGQVRDLVPRSMLRSLRRFRRHHSMDYNALALRVCITCKTHELLELDASAGRGVT